MLHKYLVALKKILAEHRLKTSLSKPAMIDKMTDGQRKPIIEARKIYLKVPTTTFGCV